MLTHTHTHIHQVETKSAPQKAIGKNRFPIFDNLIKPNEPVSNKLSSVEISQAMESSTEDANAPSEHEPPDTTEISTDAVNGNEMTENQADIENGNADEALIDDEANAKDAEMEIKGIVQGEADNNVVQSAGQVNLVQDDNIKVCFF